MAASKRNTISLILVLTLVGGAWAAEPNGTQKTPAPLSNTRYASCIVNITADPETVPLSPEAVMHLMESSAVEAKAAREQLGIDEASIRQIFPAMMFQPLTDSSRRGGNSSGFGGRRGPVSGFNGGFGVFDANQGFGPQGTPPGRGGLVSVAFRVGVTLPEDVKPAAEEYIRAVVNNLRQSLQAGYRERLDQLSGMIAEADRQRADAQEKLNQFMGVKPGSGEVARVSLDLNTNMLRGTEERLERDIQERKMSLAIMEAKRRAIEEQISQLREQAAKKLAEDTVTRELNGLLEANQAKLNDLEKMVKTGTLPTSELAPAKESLARTRIELAKRQEELTHAAGGGQLDAYAAQISQMAIQTAEERTRFELLAQQLSDARRQLESAHGPSQFAPQVRMAQMSVNALDDRIAELKLQQINTKPPSVTTVGAN
jgi:hypothetical protein